VKGCDLNLNEGFGVGRDGALKGDFQRLYSAVVLASNPL
jgi:hypothetical protein